MVEQNSNNGLSNPEFHGYIKGLLTPGAQKSADRRSWSIPVENVWVPFFMATNVMGETDIPEEVLGKPLRLAKSKDGAIKFSDSGRPVMRVHKILSEHVSIVRENFVASLQTYAGMVQEERLDDYRTAVANAQVQGAALLDTEMQEIDEAFAILKASQASAQATSEEVATDASEEAATDAPASESKSRKGKESEADPAEQLAAAAA